MIGQFCRVIGTGGIGVGTLWHMADDRILGKNESRPAALTDARDYCKQHIILHYLAQVLKDDAHVCAIGKVGDDANGARLLDEMKIAGIDTSCVEIDKSGVTMQSVCIHYPDKSVCNITMDNSTCKSVSPEYVRASLSKLPPLNEKTVMLAVPEVPLESRLALLEAGRKAGTFNVASVLCDEAAAFLQGGGLSLCDLLIINEEEAVALAGSTSHEALQKIINTYSLTIIVTMGKEGSLIVNQNSVQQKDIVPVASVVSTAGAGDAFTAGVICGLHFGLNLLDADGARSAVDVGHFLASYSVQCKHTIADSVTRKDVLNFLQFCDGVR